MNMRNRVVPLAAVSLVLVGSLSIGSNFASEVMTGDFSTISAIKWSSVIVGGGIVVFFLIRNGVFANENLEEGERGYRRRWGKITSKPKTGKRKLLMPGRKHFYVKHMYDVVVQSVRIRNSPEEPNFNEPIRATFHGKHIWYLLIIRWYVLDTDEAIYRSLTQIYQVNRAREGDDALENFVANQLLTTVRQCLGEFEEDSDGLPVITIDPELGSVPEALASSLDELTEKLGVHVKDIRPVLLTFAPEEVWRR